MKQFFLKFLHTLLPAETHSWWYRLCGTSCHKSDHIAQHHHIQFLPPSQPCQYIFFHQLQDLQLQQLQSLHLHLLLDADHELQGTAKVFSQHDLHDVHDDDPSTISTLSIHLFPSAPGPAAATAPKLTSTPC